MTAAEEIQAAIEKLTKLRDESTPGLWRGRNYEGTSLPKQRIVSVVTPAEDDEYGFERVVALGDYFTKANADLIVTLHATIDAQLEFLEAALKAVNETRGASSHSGPAFTLARAINGTA